MLKKIVEMKLKSSDDYIVGFADISDNISKDYCKYKYAISIGQKLDTEIVETVKTGPTQHYHELYTKVNNELADKIAEISKVFIENGIKNQPIQPTFEDHELEESYLETLRTPFSHKYAATRAGLGWIGKTDLLITHKFGPRLRLATILIDADESMIDVGNPINSSKCGDCNICVRQCPAGAANGMLWDINTDRDEFYDAFKCRTKCRELTKEFLGIDNSICGICVASCPIGK